MTNYKTKSKSKAYLLTGILAFGIMVISTLTLYYTVGEGHKNTSSNTVEASGKRPDYVMSEASKDVSEALTEDEMLILSQNDKVQESISAERERVRLAKIAEEERIRQEQVRLAQEREHQRLAKIEKEKQEEQQRIAQEKVKIEERAKTKKEQSKQTVNRNIEQASKPKAHGKSMLMEATGYTAYCSGCSGVTYTGVDLRANPNAKVVAVDPNVIPLGTRVYVEGYGEAVAADVGGAIKNLKIDLHMPTKQQALNWGRRTVKVTILN